MYDTNKSTVEEPLKFFQWMFIDANFDSFRLDYLYIYCQQPDAVRNDDIVSYTLINENEAGDIIDNKKSIFDFAKKLENSLKEEYQTTIKFIDRALANIAFRDNDHTRFLNLQVNILNDIKVASKIFIEKYPFIEAILNDIALYIKIVQNKDSILNEQNRDECVVGESSTEPLIVNNPVHQSVIQVFGYFKDRMESEEEYNRLIKHIESFIETQTLPNENFKRFRHIHKIKNEEIRYTFFVLYSLNKKMINRRLLCEFIKLSFDDFIEAKDGYLYSRLNDTPTYFETYIPDFIRKFDKKI